jgi:hypothetical protein
MQWHLYCPDRHSPTEEQMKSHELAAQVSEDFIRGLMIGTSLWGMGSQILAAYKDLYPSLYQAQQKQAQYTFDNWDLR